MKRTLLALTAALVAFLPQDDGAKPKEPKLPEVGAPAPTFRLNDQDGTGVAPIETGRESETWTVLAWYPKAATPG